MDTKYLFIIGGKSTLPIKGIVAASLACLFKTRGYRIVIQQLDSTLNTERKGGFVTADGYEADAAFGKYERFTGEQTSRTNHITLGRIYNNVINRERRGEYGNQTVRTNPHIIDELKNCIKQPSNNKQSDFVITEINGAIGEPDSYPIFEVIRQLRWEDEKNVCCIHVEQAVDENAQRNVRKLQELGIGTDITLLLTEQEIAEDTLTEFARASNIKLRSVVQYKTSAINYDMPLKLHRLQVDRMALRALQTADDREPELSVWRTFVSKYLSAEDSANIAVIGDILNPDLNEALFIAATANNAKLNATFINSKDINISNVSDLLTDCNGVIVAPDEAHQGIDGLLIALNRCREHNIPTLAIARGMQCMAIEFARNVMHLPEAETSESIIDLMCDKKSAATCNGSLRIGAYSCALQPESRTAEIYGNAKTIVERHRHNFEINSLYCDRFEHAGMVCSGKNPETQLTETIEIPELRWFIGTQFNPEFSTTIYAPSPILSDFVANAIIYHNEKQQNG